MLSAPVLGILFVIGAVASGALIYLRGRTLTGTIAKITVGVFALLAVVAFLI